MPEYKRDRARVDKALRQKGVVVVMGKDHAKKAEDAIKKQVKTELKRAKK